MVPFSTAWAAPFSNSLFNSIEISVHLSLSSTVNVNIYVFIISSEEVTKLHIHKATNEGKTRVPSRSSFYSEAGVALDVHYDQRRVITPIIIFVP